MRTSVSQSNVDMPLLEMVRDLYGGGLLTGDLEDLDLTASKIAALVRKEPPAEIIVAFAEIAASDGLATVYELAAKVSEYLTALEAEHNPTGFDGISYLVGVSDYNFAVLFCELWLQNRYGASLSVTIETVAGRPVTAGGKWYVLKFGKRRTGEHLW